MYIPFSAPSMLCGINQLIPHAWVDVREPLDSPDGPGYWAFEGKSDKDKIEYRTVHTVLDVSFWKGKWTRIHLPWEEQPAALTNSYHGGDER